MKMYEYLIEPALSFKKLGSGRPSKQIKTPNEPNTFLPRAVVLELGSANSF